MKKEIIQNCLWVCCFLGMAFNQAYCQERIFNSLNTENGLSHNAVLSITQDRKGFLWLATPYGLNRYDGRRFLTYLRNKEPNSISDNYILSLFTDKSGQLWAGTTNGLNRYNEFKDGFDTLFSKLPGTDASGQVDVIFQTSDNRMLIGTNRGLYYLDPGTNLVKKHPLSGSLTGNEIKTMYEDRHHNLWIGTSQGLNKVPFRQAGSKVQHFKNGNGPGTLPGDYITSITEDKEGFIWIGTHHNGLCRFNPGDASFSPLAALAEDEHVRKIFVDDKNIFWIATQKGLVVYNPFTKQIIRYLHDAKVNGSISQNSVYSIYQDNRGSMWIGTYFGGVNQLSNYSTPFYSLINQIKAPDYLFNYVTSGLEQDNAGNLWVGTEDGGLFKISMATGGTNQFLNDPRNTRTIGSNNIKTVLKDKDGNIWIGTHGGGLNLYNPKQNNFTRFSLINKITQSTAAEIPSIIEDAQNRLWVGTNMGLYIFNRTGVQLLPAVLPELDSLKKAQIKYLFKDSHNRIWLSTTAGTYLYDTNRVLTKFNYYVANNICESPDGGIWFAISNTGLARYNRQEKNVEIVLSRQNLRNKNIMCLLPGNDVSSLWLSLDKGLCQLNTTNMSYRLFAKNDGLANDNFNTGSGLKLANGELLFGGIKGITAFDPAAISFNKAIAPIYFTGLRLSDSSSNVSTTDKHIIPENIINAKEIVLNYDQNVFTITYALLNYIRPGKNSYQYILEGYNRSWIYTDQPAASFTNVPPGNYVLKVKGANNDGVWGTPISLTLKIRPPFWQRWWAYVLYTLLAIALIFLFTRYLFLRAVIKKEEALHQNKLNFFTNISHEIRTQLTLITLPLEQLAEEEHHDLPKQSGYIGLIKHNAERLQLLVNELMDFRRVESGNLRLYPALHSLPQLLEEIVATFQDMAQMQNTTINIVYNGDDIPAYFDKNQLSKVFFNLINNALKYAPPDSRIDIEIEENNKEVITRVTDNGPGIPAEFLNNIFNNYYQVGEHEKQNTGYGIGLALSKSIVDLHKGHISVQSTRSELGNRGETIFEVSLLKGAAHLQALPHVVMNMEQTTEPDEPLPTAGFNIIDPTNQPGNADLLYTILVVEDNTELRKLVCNTFKAEYVVLEAVNGDEGLQIARQEIPDIIISDVMMPLMDGYAFCRQIKTDKRTSHIPVILLTAKNTQTDQISGLEQGANLYLTKPFSKRVLQLNVNNLLLLKEQQKQIVLSTLSELPAEQNVSAPSHAAGNQLAAIDQEFLDEIIKITEEQMDKDGFGVAVLSKKIGMSPPILYKKLFALTGLTVNEFIKTRKLQKAAELITQGKLSLQDISDSIGYKDHKYFSKEFKKHFGVAPKDYKRPSDPAI